LEVEVSGTERCRGNRYVTSIHVINSAIVKLGKLQKACKVFRGASGGLLPRQFWEADQFGVRGGVEFGFMSTTTDRSVAVAYAAGGKLGTVMECEMGMVDRCADLSWCPLDDGCALLWQSHDNLTCDRMLAGDSLGMG